MTTTGTGSTRDELVTKAAADPEFAEALNSAPTTDVLNNMAPDPVRANKYVQVIAFVALSIVAVGVVVSATVTSYMGKPGGEVLALGGMAVTALAQFINNNRGTH